MKIIRSHTSIILGLFLCGVLSIDALTITVTSPDDAGANTLRMAITDLNATGDPAGNMILFNLPGPDIIINLVTPLPAITKQVTINGLDINSGNKITIEGITTVVASLAGLHFTTGAASNSTATNLIIQNFTNTLDDGAAYGILCDDNANNCSATNCQISNITSGDNPSGGPTDAEAIGIRSFGSMNTITSNEISSIMSSNDFFDNTGNTAGVYVEGTINGACSDNLINALTSGNAGDTSGSVNGIFADTLNGNCLNNIIAALTSGNGTESGDVSGIQIPTESTQQCSSNIIALLTSGNTSISDSGRVTGINIGVAKNVDDNIISQATSGNSNTGDSGDVIGIFALETETINRNSASDIISGNSASGESGLVGGIAIGLLLEACNTNLINIVASGTATTQEGALGIVIVDTTTGVSISDNTIANITGVGGITSTGSPTAGLYLVESSRPSIENNTITSVTGVDGSAHGIILGCIAVCGTGPLQAVTNSNLFNNTISNITGAINNGFGISIIEQSKGNDILYTSIFNINGKAINIVDNGAPIDAVIILEKIECRLQNNTYAITGILEPAVNLLTKQFIVQIFVSNLNMPPQIETFIAEFTVQAFGNPTEFCEIIDAGSIILEEGQFITATATAFTNVNNNTSEVSNVIIVPKCVPPNICELIDRPPLTPPDFNTLCGFISTNRKG